MDLDYEALEQRAQPGWFSQYDMQVLVPEVQKLMPGQIYVEIGVNRGRSLSVVAEAMRTGVRVIGIDSVCEPELLPFLEAHPEVKFWHMDSQVAAGVWAVAAIQLLFIDADHSYAGCKKDIASWYPKMAPGGVMLFHDFDKTSPGVIDAVSEFAKEHNYIIETFNSPLLRTSMAKIQL